MSKKNEVMEDKYASNAHSFKNVDAVDKSAVKDFDDFQKMEGLKSDADKLVQLEIKNKPKGIFQRKMTRIFGAVGDFRSMFFKGFKLGFVVGGIFGGLLGTYQAVVYRSIMYIPGAAIASGCSFGFFMGIGMVIRTEMEGMEDDFEKQKEEDRKYFV